MPSRITLKLGQVIEIGGVPVTAVYPDSIVLAIAAFDADGFMDEAADLKCAARQWRRRFDKNDQPVDDGGN